MERISNLLDAQEGKISLGWLCIRYFFPFFFCLLRPILHFCFHSTTTREIFLGPHKSGISCRLRMHCFRMITAVFRSAMRTEVYGKERYRGLVCRTLSLWLLCVCVSVCVRVCVCVCDKRRSINRQFKSCQMTGGTGSSPIWNMSQAERVWHQTHKTSTSDWEIYPVSVFELCLSLCTSWCNCIHLRLILTARPIHVFVSMCVNHITHPNLRKS